ncbi:MAG: peptidoglycan DD-metalloendopeptidase family protein [Vicinamibacterales bacterium]
MQDPRIASVMDLARQASTKAPAGETSDQAKAVQLAEEFESMLMLQMLRQMRSSMFESEEGEDQGLGMDTYTDVFNGELARTLSQAGGLGLKDVLLQGFARAGLVEGDPGVATGGAAPNGRAVSIAPLTGVPAAPAVAPAVAPAPGVGEMTPGVTGVPGIAPPDAGIGGGTPHAADVTSPLVDSTVTSAFGYRRDPFHGQSRFHSGVDLRAAYGQPVPAVSDGRVAFAGEQGGYGLTVVIDHGGGLRTRYAHLSSLDVATGETLAAGQQLGRVGQTGRATAPHLHFEVFQQGQPIDPEQAAERFEAAGLKLVALNVD